MLNNNNNQPWNIFVYSMVQTDAQFRDTIDVSIVIGDMLRMYHADTKRKGVQKMM